MAETQLQVENNLLSQSRRNVMKLAGGTVIGTALATTSGSAQSATQIENWHDLNAVRDNLNGDYVLLNDLDDKTAGYNEHVSGRAAGFEPIITFEGTFDGQGNEIGGLEINRPEQSNIGLFGVSEGTIKDVVVTDTNITGGDRRVGGLIGLLSDGG